MFPATMTQTVFHVNLKKNCHWFRGGRTFKFELELNPPLELLDAGTVLLTSTSTGAVTITHCNLNLKALDIFLRLGFKFPGRTVIQRAPNRS